MAPRPACPDHADHCPMTNPEPFLFEERRKGEDNAVLLHIKELQMTTKALDAKMTYHHGIFRKEVEQAVVRVFEHSFPDGDPDGHRKVHEAWIAEAQAKAKFWEEMRIAGAKWAGLGVLTFIATALWVAIKSEVQK